MNLFFNESELLFMLSASSLVTTDDTTVFAVSSSSEFPFTIGTAAAAALVTSARAFFGDATTRHSYTWKLPQFPLQLV